MAYAVPPAKQMFGDTENPRELVERREEFVQEMTKATVAGLTGETTWGTPDASAGQMLPPVVTNAARKGIARTALADYEMAKSTESAPAAWDRLSKEWSLLTRGAA